MPESEAARKAGAQPKQVVDKAAADVSRAVQQGTRPDADGKK